MSWLSTAVSEQEASARYPYCQHITYKRVTLTAVYVY